MARALETLEREAVVEEKEVVMAVVVEQLAVWVSPEGLGERVVAAKAVVARAVETAVVVGRGEGGGGSGGGGRRG